MEVTPATFNLPVTKVETSYGTTLFIPLPKELWRECGGCACKVCKADGSSGYWDTLALSADGGQTHMVHCPELHLPADRKAMARTRVDNSTVMAG